jgi:hypothetical protein
MKFYRPSPIELRERERERERERRWRWRWRWRWRERDHTHTIVAINVIDQSTTVGNIVSEAFDKVLALLNILSKESLCYNTDVFKAKSLDE